MSRMLSQELKDLGVELIHCEDCSYFHPVRTGKMGGVWGKCEIRDDFSVRSGKRSACKLCRMGHN